MPDTHCPSRPVITTAAFSILVTASACDPAPGSTARDLEADLDPEVELAAPVRTVEVEDWGPASVPKIAAESEQLLLAEAGAAASHWPCKFDTFQFHLPNDGIAITTPPGGFFTPFPQGIPTFDDPKLEDNYLFVVTMRDIHNNVVGFASEQEVVDFNVNESKTSYTLTLPDRGTLMLAQRESFQVLIDAVDDMIADQELVRTFDPPLVEVLTIPWTGKVVGGSGEFEGAFGVMQEIGIVYEIDLINNEFELGVIVQALHC